MSGAISDLTIGQAAAVGYFVDQKKGEVNELKQLLKNINIEKDARRKREIIKKVIAYMTLGVDVSRLFTDMIMAIETRDIVLKKMIYLYLCNYAKSEPEMAIMCINSLRRDCENEDPLVRGLALRSLCSLKLESILEYVDRPLQTCLSDVSAYVRKTAVMGVLKIHSLSPSLVETNGYVEQLYRMLQDPDATVVINVVNVLHELKLSEGGFEASREHVMMLLNRIGEFSEWGLNTILDLVARYRVTSEEELFGIMNLLDPVLRTANSGSVLATLKCFLNLTTSLPEMQSQVIARVKPPLLTLITGAHAEVQFVTLKHLNLLLHHPGARGVFDDEFRQLFVRYNEPPHVKHLKVDLLPLVANAVNARDISVELSEYVTDVDSELSRRAVRALGELAIHLPPVSEEMTRQVLSLMEVDNPFVRSQAAIILKDIVRVHPQLCELVLPCVGKYLRKVEDMEAKAGLIWMLGEFGHNVLEAPYILEHLVEGYTEEQSCDVKMQLLNACMKLFFQRPPEMQATLGRLLAKGVEDTSNQDLHDRALLCYRMLSRRDLRVAETVFAVGAATRVMDDFAEKKETDLRRKLFAEFNTLAVTSDMPSALFVGEKYQLNYDATSLYVSVVTGEYSPTKTAAQLQGPTTPSAAPAAPAAAAAEYPVHAAAPAPAAVSGSVNLLDWDEEPARPAAAPVAAARPRLNLLDFVPNMVTPPVFQQRWTEWPDVSQGTLCRLHSMPAVVSDVENALRVARIFVLASGALPNNGGFKFFVYGAESSGGGDGGLLDTGVQGPPVIYVAQVLIAGATGEVTATIKAPDSHRERGRLFGDQIVERLAQVFGAVP